MTTFQPTKLGQCFMISVEQMMQPSNHDYRLRNGIFEVEAVSEDGWTIKVLESGEYNGQQWQWGNPYVWNVLPTMYDLPSEAPQGDEIVPLIEQKQELKRKLEQSQQRAERLAQYLREQGVDPEKI
jgi:hypothetical protein